MDLGPQKTESLRSSQPIPIKARESSPNTHVEICDKQLIFVGLPYQERDQDCKNQDITSPYQDWLRSSLSKHIVKGRAFPNLHCAPESSMIDFTPQREEQASETIKSKYVSYCL